LFVALALLEDLTYFILSLGIKFFFKIRTFGRIVMHKVIIDGSFGFNGFVHEGDDLFRNVGTLAGGAIGYLFDDSSLPERSQNILATLFKIINRGCVA
jgi:hypothetical protein